jgi:hypothetical protein
MSAGPDQVRGRFAGVLLAHADGALEGRHHRLGVQRHPLHGNEGVKATLGAGSPRS